MCTQYTGRLIDVIIRCLISVWELSYLGNIKSDMLHIFIQIIFTKGMNLKENAVQQK